MNNTKHIGTYQMLRKKGVKPFDLEYHVGKIIETLNVNDVNYNTLFSNGFIEHIFDRTNFDMKMKEFEDNYIVKNNIETINNKKVKL